MGQSFKADANGQRVIVWDGWPRKVEVSNSHADERGTLGLLMSMDEAKGLIFALTLAVGNAERHDAT